jgi:hypothetical protein
MSSDIAELVATASRILAAAGPGDLIWGHASVRDPDSRGAWLKAARVITVRNPGRLVRLSFLGFLMNFPAICGFQPFLR